MAPRNPEDFSLRITSHGDSFPIGKRTLKALSDKAWRGIIQDKNMHIMVLQNVEQLSQGMMSKGLFRLINPEKNADFHKGHPDCM